MEEPGEGGVGKEVLDGWIAAFRGPLVGLFASWGSDWKAAEDLAQDTFAEAWISVGRFIGDPEDNDAVGAWLRGIAFRLHRSALRSSERRQAVPLDGCEPVSSEEEADPRQEALAEGFRRLSASHQTVLRMHYLEEGSAKEVAALLGVTLKAVESRLYQARKALKVEVDRLQAGSKNEVAR